MKVILDTNVFVSGVFFSGLPYQILRAWRDGKIQLVVSPEILEEYHRVGEILAEDHPNLDLKPVLDYVIRNAEIYAGLTCNLLRGSPWNPWSVDSCRLA